LLDIEAGKFEPDAALQYNCNGVYDIYDSPYMNVRAKSDVPLVLTARLWKDTHSVSRKVRVYNTTDMTEYCFDFTSPGTVDLREVRMIELAAKLRGNELANST
jgi:hypothetical protein